MKPSTGTFGHSTHYGFRHGALCLDHSLIDPEDVGFGFVGICHGATHIDIGTAGYKCQMVSDVAAGAAFGGGNFQTCLTERVEQIGCDLLKIADNIWIHYSEDYFIVTRAYGAAS